MQITESQARRIYLDYHAGNTMGTTAKEMGEITSQYSDKLASWQATAPQDENGYDIDFDDSSYAQYRTDGENIGKDATDGHTRAKQGGDVAKASGDTVIAGVATGAVVGTTIAAAAGSFAAAVFMPIVLYATIALGVATALTYLIKKPNKEGSEAAEKMMNPLSIADGSLNQSQSDLDITAEKIMEYSDAAYAYNEEANSNIKDAKAEYDMYMTTYKELQAKIDAGQTLRVEEKSLYQMVAGYINNTSEEIELTQEETTSKVSSVYSDMEDVQSDYDATAETMAEVKGLTDYAESFDKQTSDLCKTEAAAQIISGIGTTIASTILGALSGIAWWNYIIVAAGLAAAAGSFAAANEQLKMAKNVDAEIETRKGVQDLNLETEDKFETEVDYYESTKADVAGMEMLTPNDTGAVEDNSSSAKSEEDTSSLKKKEDKDKK